MKELSIEEKAKRYDEAIEIAKEINNEQRAQPFNVMTKVFPELKENEDKVMRKKLLELVAKHCGKTCEMYLWLEKQGEQKPDYCHHEVDLSGCSEEYRKAYYDGWNNCNQQHAQLEAEQKPDWSEEDEDILNTIINHFKIDIECTDEDDIVRWLKFLKYRYTWKPNDEQMLAINTAINVLGKGTISGKYLIELQEQLKKLKG